MATLPQQPEEADAPQLTAEQAAVLNNRLAQTQQQFAALDGKRAEFDQHLRDLVRQMNAMLAERDHDWLATFSNKLLFTIPVCANPPVAISFFGRDLIYYAFVTLHIILDYALYNSLNQDYAKHAVDSLIKHKGGFLGNMALLSVDEHGDYVHNDAFDRFQNFLGETCFPAATLSWQETKMITKTLLGVIGGTEAVEYLNYRIQPPKHRGSLGPILEYLQPLAENHEQAAQSGCYHIPFSLIASPILGYFFSINRSLVGKAISENAPWIRTQLLECVGWDHPFLNSYWFYLIKRSVILTRFLRQAHDRYRQALITATMANIDRIKTILEQPTDQDRMQLPPGIKSREELLLHLFLIKQQEAFAPWLGFKNSCEEWTGNEIEVALLTPVWVKTVQWLFT
jgi:hypothetical protein